MTHNPANPLHPNPLQPNINPISITKPVPHTYCRICGQIRYHPSTIVRQKWSRQHASTHSTQEHKLLELSGRHLLPAAAYQLAPHGIIDVVGLGIDPEMIAAYREAPSNPAT